MFNPRTFLGGVLFLLGVCQKISESLRKPVSAMKKKMFYLAVFTSVYCEFFFYVLLSHKNIDQRKLFRNIRHVTLL